MRKVSLFTLAELASTIHIGGDLAVEKAIGNFLETDRPKVLRLTCSDEDDYHFAEQEVELLSTGEVLVMDCPDDKADEPTAYRLLFTVERPISLADVPE